MSKQRPTMIRISEMLNGALTFLDGNRDAMATLSVHGKATERVNLLLDALQPALGNAHAAIHGYLEDAPKMVLDTYVQFPPELPEITDAVPDAAATTPVAFVQWILPGIEQLMACFREAAENTPAGDPRAALEGLSDQIEALAKTIANAQQSLESV